MATNQSVIDPYSSSTRAPTPVSSRFWRQPVYVSPKDGTYWHPGTDGDPEAKNPFDYVLVGSYKTPGIAQVRCSRRVALDLKKPAGSSGARTTAHGVELADIEIRLLIWTPEQLRRLEIFWNNVFTFPYSVATSIAQNGVQSAASPLGFATILGATSTATTSNSINTSFVSFDVTHEIINSVGVQSIMFTGCDGLAVDERSLGTFVMRALEFRNPGSPTKSVANTPVQSLGSNWDVKPAAAAQAAPGNNPSNLAPR